MHRVLRDAQGTCPAGGMSNALTSNRQISERYTMGDKRPAVYHFHSDVPCIDEVVATVAVDGRKWLTGPAHALDGVRPTA